MQRKRKIYAFFILTALLTGILSSVFSGGMREMYGMLQKPPLSPPSWIFPAVWSVLYVFMGISAANIYIIGGKRAEKALTVYFVQLFLNFFWSILFFGFGAYFLAFLWLCLLFAAVWYMIYLFYKINPRAAFLQVPYLLWLAFAGYLNFMFFILN